MLVWAARRISMLMVLAALLIGAGASVAGAPPAAAAEPGSLEVSMRLDNVSEFSTKEKTYSVDGTMWLAFDDALEQALDDHKIGPIDLVRFQNLVNPTSATIELLTRHDLRLDDGRHVRGYHFVGNFYSNEMDYRRFPFGEVVLSVVIEPKVGASEFIGHAVHVHAAPSGAELGARAGLIGYTLRHWSLVDEPYKRHTAIAGGAASIEGRCVFSLYYAANPIAAAVTWVLPMAIVMLILLLAPSLTAAMISERLGIPPMILLTIVVMQQTYRSQLPAVPYLTFLDKLYAYSLVVALAFFVIFILDANAMRGSPRAEEATDGRRRRIHRRDVVTQGLAVAGFVVIVALSL